LSRIVIGVHGGAQRETGHDTPAADYVQHRELLGDARRRVVQDDAVAEHDNAHVLRAARQRSGHDVR
jgi:hypothetical protein